MTEKHGQFLFIVEYGQASFVVSTSARGGRPHTPYPPRATRRAPTRTAVSCWRPVPASLALRCVASRLLTAHASPITHDSSRPPVPCGRVDVLTCGLVVLPRVRASNPDPPVDPDTGRPAARGVAHVPRGDRWPTSIHARRWVRAQDRRGINKKPVEKERQPRDFAQCVLTEDSPA